MPIWLLTKGQECTHTSTEREKCVCPSLLARWQYGAITNDRHSSRANTLQNHLFFTGVSTLGERVISAQSQKHARQKFFFFKAVNDSDYAILQNTSSYTVLGAGDSLINISVK